MGVAVMSCVRKPSREEALAMIEQGIIQDWHEGISLEELAQHLGVTAEEIAAAKRVAAGQSQEERRPRSA